MMTRGFRSPVFLFYLLVFYVLIQFGWWMYLMFALYEDIYAEPAEIRKKVFMLVGEGSVFVLILIAGIIFIRRAFRREMEFNHQQQNFILSVTHELKTPIASLKLIIQTLQSRKLDESRQTELYAQSLGEIERLDNMVANILVTRSIEEKNYLLNKSDIRLDEIAGQTIEQLRGGLLRNHEIIENLSEVSVLGDASAMRAILVNLLENAGKYAPQGSRIEVTAGTDDQVAVLSVMDNGRGIPDEQKNMVFSKFYRGENELTRKTKGTGLGLYIVRYLAELQNGVVLLKDNHPTGLIAEIRFRK